MDADELEAPVSPPEHPVNSSDTAAAEAENMISFFTPEKLTVLPGEFLGTGCVTPPHCPCPHQEDDVV
ncbi:hypothetical protein [Rhodococcus sp. NCIMB 12038]|uniref:hypothetical protein n=1 Tax=Rhodococcus sp. NCIMB 12038 TaxID=933800 RepID=UPI0015C64994|nr:hypothetical protein [Rhodococcus sp. NCIMB 12038]